jgi:heme-degrading monooxygenase HmoA
MIARIWHGRVPKEKASSYRAFLTARAIPDYRSTPGNAAAFVLERDEEGVSHLLTLSLWDSLADVRAFAGEDVERARYYPEDDDYLLEKETFVQHYEVVARA